MKKAILFLFLALPFFVFQSCGEDEIPELTDYDVPQGVITGKVFAELDVTNLVYENAPSGTITARVSYADLGIEAAEGTLSTYKYYTGTINSQGNYTLSVDASTAGTQVIIFLDDFIENQVIGEDIATGSPITKRTIYSVNDFSTTLFSGRTVIRDIYFSSN